MGWLRTFTVCALERPRRGQPHCGSRQSQGELCYCSVMGAPEVADSSVAARDAITKVFLKAIQTSRTLPTEVRVRSQKLKDCLTPLMEFLGVAVRVANRLPASDEARSHLLGFFHGDFGGM